MLVRAIQPELLDSLPAEDAAAKRSRLDLRLINHLMGNFRWVERQLASLPDRTRIIELGAGEGRLLNRLAGKDYAVTGVDLAPRPNDLHAAAKWVQCDLFEFGDFHDAVVVATLFVHHLNPGELRQLGERLATARALLFSEPWRSRVSLFCGCAIFPFVNHVTRHDMMTSIRAGFRMGELREALGLDKRWMVREEISVLGACRLAARKK